MKMKGSDMELRTPGEFCYDAWCMNAGVETQTPYDRAKGNAMGTLFTDLMNNHMAQGYFRYGSCKKYRDSPIDFKQRIKDAVNLFFNDGNIEHFVDVANWARMAFHYQRHPKRHYTTAIKERE